MLVIRNRKETVRRRDILRAACAVMTARGYHDARVDDIAAEAELGKGTLYLYFRDKERLFEAVIEDLFDGLDERLKAASSRGSAMDALLGLAAEMLDFSDQNRSFLLQFPLENQGLNGGRARTALERQRSKQLRVVAEGLARGVQEGIVRRHDPLLGSHFFLALVRMFMIRKVMERADAPLRFKAAELVELFLGGLGSAERRPRRDGGAD